MRDYQPPYANLVGDDFEKALRRAVQHVLKFHNIRDGVIEADLVAATKGVALEYGNKS